jgi:hypothetical protein
MRYFILICIPACVARSQLGLSALDIFHPDWLQDYRDDPDEHKALYTPFLNQHGSKIGKTRTDHPYMEDAVFPGVHSHYSFLPSPSIGFGHLTSGRAFG